MREFIAAFRQFRKSPSFATTVVLTIALGIGALREFLSKMVPSVAKAHRIC